MYCRDPNSVYPVIAKLAPLISQKSQPSKTNLLSSESSSTSFENPPQYASNGRLRTQNNPSYSQEFGSISKSEGKVSNGLGRKGKFALYSPVVHAHVL
jgi:hypothetical protein